MSLGSVLVLSKVEENEQEEPVNSTLQGILSRRWYRRELKVLEGNDT